MCAQKKWGFQPIPILCRILCVRKKVEKKSHDILLFQLIVANSNVFEIVVSTEPLDREKKKTPSIRLMPTMLHYLIPKSLWKHCIFLVLFRFVPFFFLWINWLHIHSSTQYKFIFSQIFLFIPHHYVSSLSFFFGTIIRHIVVYIHCTLYH